MPRLAPVLAALVAAVLAACSRNPRDGAVYPPPDARGGATDARPQGGGARRAPSGQAAAARPAIAADSARGRLAARPTRGPFPDSVATGLLRLGLDTARRARDGVVYVPAGYRADRPAPLLVMLHGEGATPRAAVAPLRALADSTGMILVAPQSRARTWDAIGGGTIGADVAFLDRALARTFAQYAIDPARVTLAGFSEGGSYALLLALGNGDLFRRVIAFSPGGIPGAALPRNGRPRIFVAHGVGDRVKRISTTRRFVVDELEQRGYDVRFVEFEGGHTITPEVAQTAFEWIYAYGR